MVADSKQTDFCAYLSAILLAGLLLNALARWWWMDPVAGLVMVPVIIKEGMSGLRGEACCDHCGCRQDGASLANGYASDAMDGGRL